MPTALLVHASALAQCTNALLQHLVVNGVYALQKQSDEKAPGDVGNFGDNFKPADEAEYAALQVCRCSVMMFTHA
jgi:hypothetical protein